MKKTRYPSWLQWQSIVEARIAAVTKNCGILGSDLAGNTTNNVVAVKNPNQNQSSMPYVRVIFSGVRPGHDDERSATPDQDSFEYSTLSSRKMLQKTPYIRERITFALEIFAQSYDHILQISQALVSGLKQTGFLTYTYNQTQNSEETTLHTDTWSLEIDEDAGLFMASMMYTICIHSDLALDDSAVVPIITVVSSETDSIGNNNDAEERTKTIT